MFILPPNCMVPSATLLTMSPVLPSFLYRMSHTSSTAFVLQFAGILIAIPGPHGIHGFLRRLSRLTSADRPPLCSSRSISLRRNSPCRERISTGRSLFRHIKQLPRRLCGCICKRFEQEQRAESLGKGCSFRQVATLRGFGMEPALRLKGEPHMSTTAREMSKNFISGVMVLDSKLAREATELVHDTESTLLFNH